MRERRGKRNGRKYTGLIAACAVCLTLLVSGITGQAARTGTVTVDGARVREEAGTDARRVCSLPIDTTVDVTGEAESGGSTWYNISFTYEGQQMSGWLRSDLLTVTGTDEPEETPEEEEPVDEDGGGTAAAGAYTIQEPAEAYSGADSLTQTTVQAGDQSYTAYQASGSDELYLVWAAAPDGSTGWYWYDPAEGTFQRDSGQFSSQGLISALQNELTTLKQTSADKLSQRLYIIIGLGALSAVLVIVVTILVIRGRNVEYEYYDDEDGEENFDDFVDAVKQKKNRDAEEKYDEEDGEEEEKPDLSLTSNLPEIDMSAVEEAEEEAAAEKREKQAEKTDDEEGAEGFDIEILDLDDLNL